VPERRTASLARQEESSIAVRRVLLCATASTELAEERGAPSA